MFALFLHLLYVRTVVCPFLKTDILKSYMWYTLKTLNVEFSSLLSQTLVQNKVVVVTNIVFLIL